MIGYKKEPYFNTCVHVCGNCFYHLFSMHSFQINIFADSVTLTRCCFRANANTRNIPFLIKVYCPGSRYLSSRSSPRQTPYIPIPSFYFIVSTQHYFIFCKHTMKEFIFYQLDIWFQFLAVQASWGFCMTSYQTTTVGSRILVASCVASPHLPPPTSFTWL